MDALEECFPPAFEDELAGPGGDSSEKLVRASLRSIRATACLGSPDFALHLAKTAGEALALARACGLDRKEQEAVWWAASLHDIGKAGIAREILAKPGELDDRQTREVRRHTVLGHRLLDGVDHDLFRLCAVVALFHHERWDGGGYPEGIAGERIPLPVRIVTIADVYDCMTAGRPYCGPRSSAEALAELEIHAGTQFDPELVPLFLSLKKNKNGSADRRAPG